MAVKLRLILKEGHWSLATKSLVLALFWFWLPFWIFAFFSFLLFFWNYFELASFYWRSFFALLIVSGMALYFPDYRILFLALVFSLFFVLLGLESFLFVNKKEIYRIFNFLLISASLLFFFWAEFFASTGVYLFIILALVNYWLFRDLFFLYEGEKNNKEGRVYAISLTLIMLESIWAIKFLPIGFINQSAISILILIGIQELVLSLEKKREINFFLLLLTVFSAVFLFVLFFSGWSVN